MKLLVVGSKRVKGITKPEKGSNPFDITNVLFLDHSENTSRGSVTVSGHGYEAKEIGCTPEVFEAFENYTGKFPAYFDAELGMEQRGDNQNAIIVAMKPATTPAASASK